MSVAPDKCLLFMELRSESGAAIGAELTNPEGLPLSSEEGWSTVLGLHGEGKDPTSLAFQNPGEHPAEMVVEAEGFPFALRVWLSPGAKLAVEGEVWLSVRPLTTGVDLIG